MIVMLLIVFVVAAAAADDDTHLHSSSFSQYRRSMHHCHMEKIMMTMKKLIIRSLMESLYKGMMDKARISTCSSLLLETSDNWLSTRRQTPM